jgi:hypothetical protein
MLMPAPAMIITRLYAERGSISIFFALLLPALILLFGFSIEFGNWLVHKRHLQTQADAAALAGGSLFAGCFTDDPVAGSDAIEAEASKYHGGPGAPYNTQVGGARAGAIDVLYQSKTYPDGASFVDPDAQETHPCDPDGQYMFDVKASESGLPLALSYLGIPTPTLRAHARVQLRPIHSARPSMPLAVPDVNPRQVAVTFVNEATGASLSGCSGPALLPSSACTFLLSKDATGAGGLNFWRGDATVTFPAAPARIGVRVGAGGQVGSCAGTAGTGNYRCFDSGATSRGLLLIRNYAPGSTTTSDPPVLDGVWPTTCAGSPFFSDAQAPTGSCGSGMQAEVNFGTGSTRPNANYHVRARLGSGTPVDLIPVSFESATNAWLWSTAAGAFAIAPGAGVQAATLSWEVNDTSATIGGKACRAAGAGGNPCKDDFQSGPHHRYYAAPVDESGPVRAMELGESGNALGPSSLKPGMHTLSVVVGLAGNFQLNRPCTGAGSGGGYNCASDSPIVLRFASASGSSTYAIDCGTPAGSSGGGDLYLQVRYGCANRFSINATDSCDPIAFTPYPECAPVGNVGSGDKLGQIRQAMNDRFTSGGTCVANNYPAIVSDDPRIVVLVMTDFSAFSGSGGSRNVPVVTFAAFYVTGWDGAPGGCDNEPYPRVGSPQKGDVWGHFVKPIEPNNDDVSDDLLCDADALVPCVAVMTR